MTGTNRRARGEGGVYWNDKRQRFIATQTVGYDGRGRAIRKTGSGKTESAALRELRARVRDYEAGLMPEAHRVTISDVVEDWLEFGRSDVSERTEQGNEIHYLRHIKPHLGGRRVRDLRPDEVDRWLLRLAPNLSTSTLKQVRSVLKRSIDRAMKRGLAERNVVDLCSAPKGRPGRKSKSLTFQQASDVLDKTRGHPLHAYIVVSLLARARPEEVRALRWDAVELESRDGVPPHIDVWRSVREGGDTKTRKSRRTLAISGYVAAVLASHREAQAAIKAKAGDAWQENGLVFPSQVGTLQDSHNVRRSFRSALRLVPGIVPEEWTPRDLRHSFVSILSQHGLPIEEISRLMGHSGTAVTELVYRHELRPVLEAGAAVMDVVFPVLKADGADDGDAA
jgi:integrase